MKEKFAKFLKSWNLFEIIFLFSSFFALILCFVFSVDRSWLTLTSSLLGVVAVLFVAKGFVIAPIVNLIYGGFYIAISALQHYFGEVIIYACVMTPIYIFSIISWLGNRSKEQEEIVEVNKIYWKEYLAIFLGAIVATFSFYFILKALNTNELEINTASLIFSLVASYLMLRRSSFYALAFLADDIIAIALWSMAVINFGLQFLPTVVSFCVFLINDLYGFIHWKIQERRQDKMVDIDSRILEIVKSNIY